MYDLYGSNEYYKEENTWYKKEWQDQDQEQEIDQSKTRTVYSKHGNGNQYNDEERMSGRDEVGGGHL